MREILNDNGINTGENTINIDFSETQYYDNIKNIDESKKNEKIESDKSVIKQKLLLELSDFSITKEDFDIQNENNNIIIISNSSYFSSIIGLNGIQEKKDTRTRKNRIKYDNLDKYTKKLYESNLEKEIFMKKLIKHCAEKNLNFTSIYSGGGCVISEGNITGIGIKKFLRDNGDIIEKNKGTIIHENQHIKFNKYCEEKGIKHNGILNILNEIIAHCTNTKKENGEIDFEKIFDTMKDNENYFKTSEIKDINEYYKTLDILIKRTEIELNNNNLDSVMIKLIEEYSKEN